MIELIREKANKLEDDLWTHAKDTHGLERNRETLRRVQATIGRLVDAEAKKSGVPTSITEKPDQSVDDGLALAFLSIGLVQEEETADQALDALVYAASAVSAIRVLSFLPASLNDTDRASIVAKVLANRRHAEHYALAEYAQKYWRENIDPTLSASKAANELLRVVPLSHKKLAEVISAEKKKRS